MTKYIRALGLVGCLGLMILAVPEVARADQTTGGEVETRVWTCPMHPEVRTHKAGSCPICHMDLVLVQKENKHSNSHLAVSARQSANLGLIPYKVERKPLEVNLTLGARFTSVREVAFQVYESDIGLLQTGLKFTGASPAHPGAEVQGHITHIDTMVDPMSRTVRVMGAIDSKLGFHPLIEGTFVGHITRLLPAEIVIPEDGVLNSGTRHLAFVLHQDGNVERRDLTLGVKSKGYIQVLQGLVEGDEISASANFLLDSESRIRGDHDQMDH